MDDLSGRLDSEELRAGVHRLAERLSAACNYLEAFRVGARDAQLHPGAHTAFVEKAAMQVDLADQEFHQLREQLLKL